ncbi:hypothetical protein AWW68_10030 [Roseivirga spongicola]|jgi:DNA-binding NarL/FixJ family response regulator|uniref:LuxR family transcriptional regulator n=1 Tax=Roseivirga spongicola TaxID=333140 RepID=A0A150XBP5_9BACT|nr:MULTISPECIES: response regulator transcription factor [Roseivirga]KYG76143.1 hypothetical protein AWW68_10030 [Roseivirga spongicola]MBO6659336.1 response regulator transcription factor [Roseivirga sp.]MBO6907927.1 response regulator transcription factor [Roseivirga sp.]
MNKPVSLFIVDDHPLIVDGLNAYINKSSDFEVVGTASSGKEALTKLKEVSADIVMTDIQMPGISGIELTEQLKKQRSDQKIIVLTMFGDAPYIKKLLQLGVDGYVLKDIDRTELYNALNTVANGGHFYSKEITEVMMNKLRGVDQKLPVGAADLTDREKEILALILAQKSNQEIAEELFISGRTVEAHKRNMLSKTGSKNVAGLVIFALENQIFTHL